MTRDTIAQQSGTSGGGMRAALSVSQATLERTSCLLPVTDTTLQWDGVSRACRDGGVSTGSAQEPPSSFRVKAPHATAPRAGPYWTTAEIGLAPTVSWQEIVWDTEAAHVTFALAPILLADAAHGVLPRTTGALRWCSWQVPVESPTPSVHAILLGHVPDDVFEGERIIIVPSLPVDDPLARHVVLVLQATVAACSSAERLYAEALAEALVVHFLRRYAASRPSVPMTTGGFTPYKLHRVLAYIKAGLEHELSLTTLAAVAQMSLTHFAHMFKQAMGLPPHQYVVLCRMEQAKRLLVDTEVPLTEIGPQVGCADQSHFTALFRKHASMTPQAYRNAARRAL